MIPLEPPPEELEKMDRLFRSALRKAEPGVTLGAISYLWACLDPESGACESVERAAVEAWGLMADFTLREIGLGTGRQVDAAYRALFLASGETGIPIDHPKGIDVTRDVAGTARRHAETMLGFEVAGILRF